MKEHTAMLCLLKGLTYNPNQMSPMQYKGRAGGINQNGDY